MSSFHVILLGFVLLPPSFSAAAAAAALLLGQSLGVVYGA